MYLSWNQKTISDFSEKNIASLYNEGYVFTRKGKGVMNQTRSVRIDLRKFELSSENKRILRKVEALDLNITPLPYSKYSWEIGKLAKDFYDKKFGNGTMTANKVKELMTDKDKSNFNSVFMYSMNDERLTISKPIGYAICYTNDEVFHYSYPFYELRTPNSELKNIGLGMMTLAIVAAQKNNKEYIYLGSFQRPTDVYKLQFKGLEWFDGTSWSHNTDALKKISSDLK